MTEQQSDSASEAETKFFSFNTERLDRFLQWLALEIATTPERRQMLTDELLRFSGGRLDICRIQVRPQRSGSDVSVLFELQPNPQLIDRMNFLHDRLKARDKAQPAAQTRGSSQ